MFIRNFNKAFIICKEKSVGGNVGVFLFSSVGNPSVKHFLRCFVFAIFTFGEAGFNSVGTGGNEVTNELRITLDVSKVIRGTCERTEEFTQKYPLKRT